MMTIQTNIKDTARFLRSAKINILRSQTKLAHKLTKTGYNLLRIKAPFWHGGLKESIAMKLFRKKGELFIAGGWMMQQKALANEYGLRQPMMINRHNAPELDLWAMEKGLFIGQDIITVGGKGTHLGRQNRFFEPTFLQLNSMVPKVAEHVIVQALLRTRG